MKLSPTAGRRGRKGFAEDAKGTAKKVFFCVLCVISASSASGIQESYQ